MNDEERKDVEKVQGLYPGGCCICDDKPLTLAENLKYELRMFVGCGLIGALVGLFFVIGDWISTCLFGELTVFSRIVGFITAQIIVVIALIVIGFTMSCIISICQRIAKAIRRT